MTKEDLGWNPNRVLFGLSRIGYTPHAAIADIVDNSVSNGATNIQVIIRKEREDLASTRKNNIKDYVIIDDGDGMDKDGIITALSLGLQDDDYPEGSLSKFGLGLKSASFSQGKILEVISSTEGDFLKYQVDLNVIEDQYFCTKCDLNTEDAELIEKYLHKNKGTIVRITDIHQSNHPSLKTTVDELNYRLGTIYYYFLKDGLNLFLNGVQIKEYDVLFTSEANLNGNLDEHEWSGKTVNWIKKPTSQTLDIDSDPIVQAIVEVTQLPHPPIHSLDGEGEQKRIRDMYKISAGNYGYYVYRNKRLISWAERFEGIIPRDQDFYSFRGRILLDSSADDAFNIDVKKSHLILSDEAHDALNDLSDEYKRKSRKAWQKANTIKKQMLGQDTNSVTNEIAGHLPIDDSSHGDGLPTADEVKEEKDREKIVKEKIKEKIQHEVESEKEQEGNDTPVTDDDVKNYISGGVSIENKRIFRVSHIEDNLLWEPYYDDDHGVCVRINRNHRFSRCIFEDNINNMDLQVIIELLLLQASQAEISMRKSPNYDIEIVEELVFDFREKVSSLLVSMMRSKSVKLPPL